MARFCRSLLHLHEMATSRQTGEPSPSCKKIPSDARAESELQKKSQRRTSRIRAAKKFPATHEPNPSCKKIPSDARAESELQKNSQPRTSRIRAAKKFPATHEPSPSCKKIPSHARAESELQKNSQRRTSRPRAAKKFLDYGRAVPELHIIARGRQAALSMPIGRLDFPLTNSASRTKSYPPPQRGLKKKSEMPVD